MDMTFSLLELKFWYSSASSRKSVPINPTSAVLQKYSPTVYYKPNNTLPGILSNIVREKCKLHARSNISYGKCMGGNGNGLGNEIVAVQFNCYSLTLHHPTREVVFGVEGGARVKDEMGGCSHLFRIDVWNSCILDYL